MTSPAHRRPATLVAAVVLALSLALAACSSGSEAGSGFRLAASQLQTTAPGSAAVGQPGGPGSVTTLVATAIGPEVEVVAQHPDLAEQPAPSQALGSTTMPPIPREGLNAAGVRPTEAGWVYENPTYYGKPLVFVVTAEQGDWLRVMVPARPNHQEGWVRKADVTLSQHDYRGELVLAERTFRVWHGSELIAETPVVVGTDRSPTPLGRLYVNEIHHTSEIGLSPSGTYGPFILSTNAYSETLDLFDGGLPVIAFHGTNAPDLLGSASSNGCVRMPNDVVTMLAETIPSGTPIDVVA
jgi:lipoprotein-anchoring transpeptidase ErfK/SrfK